MAAATASGRRRRERSVCGMADVRYPAPAAANAKVSGQRHGRRVGVALLAGPEADPVPELSSGRGEVVAVGRVGQDVQGDVLTAGIEGNVRVGDGWNVAITERDEDVAIELGGEPGAVS